MDFDFLITVKNYEESDDFYYFELEGLVQTELGYILWADPILLSKN